MSNRAPVRKVIVHYHLFKNGGTSLEKLLRQSLGEQWVSYDKAEPGAKISAAEMQHWIESHPDVRAVSSHQLVPPRPVGNFQAFPVVFLRDPLARVRSAYLFEWKKQMGRDSPQGSLSEYIGAKFEQRNSSVIANFQVSRLSNASYQNVHQRLHRYNEALLSRAVAFLDQLPFIGIVERFSESLLLMEATLGQHFPDIEFCEYRENVTQHEQLPRERIVADLRRDIGNELFDELCVRNRLDLQLFSYALGRFDASLDKHVRGHA